MQASRLRETAAEARVTPGSSVPVAPETSEWRTQTVKLETATSATDAFLEGRLPAMPDLSFRQSAQKLAAAISRCRHCGHVRCRGHAVLP